MISCYGYEHRDQDAFESCRICWPILLVSNDADDGLWQLIGATDADSSTGKIGHLHHAADEDPTLIDVLDLPPGHSAPASEDLGPATSNTRPKPSARRASVAGDRLGEANALCNLLCRDPRGADALIWAVPRGAYSGSRGISARGLGRAHPPDPHARRVGTGRTVDRTDPVIGSLQPAVTAGTP